MHEGPSSLLAMLRRPPKNLPKFVRYDGDLWAYTYAAGGFEGYRALRTGRRLAPDLPLYASRKGSSS